MRHPSPDGVVDSICPVLVSLAANLHGSSASTRRDVCPNRRCVLRCPTLFCYFCKKSNSRAAAHSPVRPLSVPSTWMLAPSWSPVFCLAADASISPPCPLVSHGSICPLPVQLSSVKRRLQGCPVPLKPTRAPLRVPWVGCQLASRWICPKQMIQILDILGRTISRPSLHLASHI